MDIDRNAPVITRDEIQIKASLNTVWNLFTNISEWPEWHKEIESASLQTSLAVGSIFQWSTAGLNITSTVGELILKERIAWSGLVQGIMGIHVWNFSVIEDGVLVKTEESWEGEPVRLQVDFLQQALDQSIRSWLESLKGEAERKEKDLSLKAQDK
jgi:uncharacterized membrane protein